MTFVASWLPYIAAGASALSTKKQSSAEADTLQQQSTALQNQAQTARDQTRVDEEAQRRKNRQFLGEQAASIAQTNTGSGGSNGLLTKQSAVNAELDALNIRYQGQLKSSQLESEAQGLLAQAKRTKSTGNYMAGTQLLSSIYGAYTRSSTLKG